MLVAVPLVAPDRGGIGGVWIVRTVVAVAAAVLPIRIIDAVRRVFAAVPPVRIADGVCVVRVGAEVAEVFSCLSIPEVGRVSVDKAGNKHREKGR